MLGSDDQWFRPVDVTAAPDGAVFVADWYDGGVGGHAFRDQTTGRIFRVAVEQRGVDVELAARGPDGRRIAVDSPFDRQGTETLVAAPSISGDWELTVRAREPAAPSGRYAIRLCVMNHTSTAADVDSERRADSACRCG